MKFGMVVIPLVFTVK